jgi:hypothetical protein
MPYISGLFLKNSCAQSMKIVAGMQAIEVSHCVQRNKVGRFELKAESIK